MTLHLPDDLGMTEAELRLELAIMLFKKEKLRLPEAARLAGESDIDLWRLITMPPVAPPGNIKRRSSGDYTVADFEEDLRTLKGLGRL